MNAVVSSEALTQPLEVLPTQSAADNQVQVSLAPPDVLLVDDDEMARERLRLILEGAGYAVSIAGNGFEALRLLHGRFVPLLLTDVVMPVMGGLELCRAVRAIAFPSYLYAIVLSIRDDAAEVVEGLDAGADDYISKRATKSEVLARLSVGRRIVGLDRALRHSILRSQLLADMDALTGACNRHRLVDCLEQEISRSRQYGRWLSVLMCDLDHFKAINDQGGHALGDKALQTFVARARQALGDEGCWIGRYGGDEFVVVLPNTRVEGACLAAERLQRVLASNPLAYPDGGALPLTVSIGITGVGPAGLRCQRQGSFPQLR